MNNIDIQRSKSEHSSKRTFKNIIFFLGISIMFLFITTIVVIIFVFYRYGFIFMVINNNNSNYVNIPNGKVAYDLQTLSFKNHSLQRFHSTVLILDEEENFDSIVYDHEDSLSVVVNAVSYDDKKSFVPCNGECKCYVDERNDLRSVDRVLFYSYRYSSVVLVSFISFAVAKFVDNHIDNCYESAKGLLENDAPITCLMEDVECEIDEVKDKVTERGNGRKHYKCKGHCVTSSRFRTPEGIQAAEDMDCENVWGEVQIVRVTSVDAYKMSVNYSYKRKDGLKDYTYDQKFHNWIYTAEAKYRSNYLSPLCKSVKTSYWYYNPSQNKQYKQLKSVSPCRSSSRLEDPNIMCERHV